LKIGGPAAPASGFDAQGDAGRVRKGAGPGGAGIEVGQRRPLRLRRGEAGWIESGGSEKAVPVGRISRGSAGGLAAGVRTNW